MIDYDAYDKETVDVAFVAVKYGKYAENVEETEEFLVNNTSSLEQITIESIVRI